MFTSQSFELFLLIKSKAIRKSKSPRCNMIFLDDISLNEKDEVLSCSDDNWSTKKVRIRKKIVELSLE